MNTAVIGTGYLGSTLCKRLSRDGMLALSTYRARQCFDDSVRFDLFNDRLPDRLDISKADVVVFSAKPDDEVEPERLVRAMTSLFEVCRHRRVIYLSSDAVFDGSKGGYTEDDLPNPITEYGRHKLACEVLLAAIVPNHCVLRTSYLYGYSLGRLDGRLDECRRRLEAGCTLERFDDMFKSPVEVNQLAELIAALAESDFCGVLHVPGRRMSVYEFTRTALEDMGVDTRGLVPVSIPAHPPAGCLRDTSLQSKLLPQLLDFQPMPLELALCPDAYLAPALKRAEAAA